jgi:hypothetical protein
MKRPHDSPTLRNLSGEESRLAADRRSALQQEQAADTDLDTRLQPVDLPSVAATHNG